MRRNIIFATTILFLASALQAENFAQDPKARVRIGLEYFQTPHMEYLNVKVTGRLDKRYEPVEGIGVSFFLADPSDQTFLGKLVTDTDGLINFELPEVYYTMAKDLLEFNFYAVLDTSPTYQDASKELSIKKVILGLEYIDRDSIKMVRANVSELDSSGNITPQNRVILKFYIERPLGNLPIGEEINRTDEEGNVTIDFPTDIPGDSEGNVKVIVRIEENDKYGNVEKTEILSWGVPTQLDQKEIRRSLWSSGANAPITLLILVNSLILWVWGTIFYIGFKIYKISKL